MPRRRFAKEDLVAKVWIDGDWREVTYVDAADPINPPHYKDLSPEPIDVIEGWKLPYHLGTVIKYLARHPHKGRPLEDLKKARWFLDRYIELLARNV
jgi:hypothetical protein